MGLSRLLTCLVLLLVLALPWPASALELRTASERIVAVGDLHGDFVAWRAIVRDAGLVDYSGRWIGGRTLLVQMGDVPDRGPDSRAIMRDLIRLSAEAPKQGGRVIVLVGNHEAMLMSGDVAYVSAGEYASFVDKSSEQRRAAVFQANRAAITAFYRRRDPAKDSAAIRAAWDAATPLGSIELQRAWHRKGDLAAGFCAILPWRALATPCSCITASARPMPAGPWHGSMLR